MNLDVFLVTLIAIAQLITTIYGVLVSITEKHFKRAVVLGIVGGIGVGLTVWAAIRNSRAQDGLQTQLKKIEQNTEKPPIVNVNPTPVTVNVPKPALAPLSSNVSLDHFESAIYETQDGAVKKRVWLSPGYKVEANNFFVNSGPAMADNVRGYGEIYLVPSNASKPDSAKDAEKYKDLKELIPRFKKSLAEHLPQTRRGIISPNGRDYMWFTANSARNITQDDMDKLATGGELLFLILSEHYTDPSGGHYIHICRIAQPPAFNPEVWQFCGTFEDHK